MPRLKTTTTTYKRRKDTATKSRITNQFDWVDPFPLGFGTKPEKMVYAAFRNLGIEFYYLNDLQFRDDYLEFFKEYQADFYVPAANLVIEIQGGYWHSKPEVIDSDSYKFAVYEAFGKRAVAWWDYEIYQDLYGLIQRTPELAGLIRNNGQGKELAPMKRTLTDSSKGIRTGNARKRKPYKQFYGTRKSTLRKPRSSYAATR